MAKLNIPDKVCPHCGGTDYYVRTRGNSIQYSCANEQIEKARIHRKTHKEAVRATNKRYRDSHKEQLLKYQRRWKASHQDQIKAWNNAHKEQLNKIWSRLRKRDSTELTDKYVKGIIVCSIYLQSGVRPSTKVITPEQVEKYRKSILVHRQLKQLKTQEK